MSLVPGWRARSSEIEPCASRVLIAGLLTPCISWVISRHVPPWTESDRIVVWSLAAWLLVAVGFLVATWIWPAPSMARRVLGIIIDVATITVMLYWFDTGGSGIVFIYLFIIFDNGFRYGRGYLYLSQAVSAVGLLLIAANVSWWKSNLVASIGWFNALITLPLYVSALTEHLNVARAKADEALSECIERQPRPS